MSARPARTTALALAVLLGLGALVALLGGGGGGDDAEESTASAVAGDAAEESSRLNSGGATDVPVGAPVPSAAKAAQAPEAPSDAFAEESASPTSPPSPPSVADPGGLGGAPLPQAVATGNSRIIKTAVLSLDVNKGKLTEANQRVLDVVARAGGWVQSSEMSKTRSSLVLKVPSGHLESVTRELRDLGKVRSESIAGEDVSSEYVDLEARLTHWRSQEAVFLGLMAKAKTIPETIQIQQQLSVIQEQIEQLEGRRRYLEGQTAFSTVRLSLLEAGAAATEPKDGESASTLGEAWEDAAGAALAVLGGTLVVLGVALPLALVLGIPALVVLALRRRQSRPAAPLGA